MSYELARSLIDKGGPAIVAIAALSVLALAVVFWKLGQMLLAGFWTRRGAAEAVDLFVAGDKAEAVARLSGLRDVRSRVLAPALAALHRGLPETKVREEVTRLAKRELSTLSLGNRILGLTVEIAPLIGLLGTVLGMIEAFQTLQSAGSRADPSALAGGIWQALLTTAAGMTVAIPAAVALAWFEAQLSRLALDLEDLATRIFLSGDIR